MTLDGIVSIAANLWKNDDVNVINSLDLLSLLLLRACVQNKNEKQKKKLFGKKRLFMP